MSSLTILFIFIPVLALILLGLNVLLATYNPDAEKTSPFECGFTSFSQTRSPFHVSFYLIGILFLIFDLEVALLYPYSIATYFNNFYGLWIVVLFVLILTLGFIFEFAKGALKITNEN